jgi:hypothetical protein
MLHLSTVHSSTQDNILKHQISIVKGPIWLVRKRIPRIFCGNEATPGTRFVCDGMFAGHAVYGAPLDLLWQIGVPTNQDDVHDWRRAAGLADGRVKSDYALGATEGVTDETGRDTAFEDDATYVHVPNWPDPLVKTVLLGGYGQRLDNGDGDGGWGMVHFVAWEGKMGKSEPLASTMCRDTALRVHLSGECSEVDWGANASSLTEQQKTRFKLALAGCVRTMRVGEICQMRLPPDFLRVGDGDDGVHMQVELVCINQHMLTNDSCAFGACVHPAVCPHHSLSVCHNLSASVHLHMRVRTSTAYCCHMHSHDRSSDVCTTWHSYAAWQHPQASLFTTHPHLFVSVVARCHVHSCVSVVARCHVHGGVSVVA